MPPVLLLACNFFHYQYHSLRLWYVCYVFLLLKTYHFKLSTMAGPSKLLGEGSICSVLVKKLHPKDIVAGAFPNAVVTEGLHNLNAARVSKGHRSGRAVMKNAVYFTTPSILNETVGASIGFVKVVQSCEDGRQFQTAVCATPIARANAQEGVELGPTSLRRTQDLDFSYQVVWVSCLWQRSKSMAT